MNKEDISDFRDDIIQSGGTLSMIGVINLNEEISKLRFYLLSMEEFIENREMAEITKLGNTIKGLTEQQKSEFWLWHYPVHWDEIFYNNFRTSSFITLISFFESMLNIACRDVEIINWNQKKCSDLKGSILQRSRRFLKDNGEFLKPREESWEKMISIYKLRNAFVHNESDTRQNDHLKKIVNETPFLSGNQGTLEIEKGFCFYCLDLIELFLIDLFDEIHNLCERVRESEQKF